MSKIFLAIILGTFIAAAALADSLTDQGEKLYRAGDYKGAAKYFASSLQAGVNSRALYFAACCLLKSGDIDSAKNSFQMLIDNFPQSQEAQLANSALKSLSAYKNTDQLKSSSNTIGHPTSNQIQKTTKINDPLADKLITIHRHTENTDRIVEIVKDGLSQVPQHVKAVLVEGSYQILIAPMTMDVTDTEDKPRGYNNGGGWDNAGGVFLPNSKRIVVGERVSWQCNPPTFNNRAGATIRHEIGHAYDQYLGKTINNTWTISSSPFLRQTYAEDAQQLTNTLRTEFDYYVQPDGAGENELFAELFYASCLKANEGSGRSDSARQLAHTFPKTFKLIQDLINQRALERFTASDN